MHTLSILCYETHCILRYLYFSNTLFVIFISKNTNFRAVYSACKLPSFLAGETMGQKNIIIHY